MKRLYSLRWWALASFLIAVSYGGIRLYYALTGGFTLGNITSQLAYDPRWETHVPSPEECLDIDLALNQSYEYLGKGCQAYVFGSHDGNYVIKFFKYQRFRPQQWVNLFNFIPAIANYQKNKAIIKKERLENVFRSWIIAYEDLREETGVVYVHLNKTNHLQKKLNIIDKLGVSHQLDLDQIEFLVQRRARMLCPTLTSLVAEKNSSKAQHIIDRLLIMLLSEYSRGFADNDHALMQNTGVWQGNPVHIDVGQFISNRSVKDPAVYKQELYDKTYKFKFWLRKLDQSLAEYLENKLLAIIGEDYFLKKPYVHKGDVAKIPHEMLAK